MYHIYIVRNKLDGKEYVGITKNLKERWASHRKATEKYVFHNAVRKYKIENFEFIDFASAKDYKNACEIEILLIKDRNTKIPNGYNMTEGGEGIFDYVFTDEHKRKLSESHKGQTPGNKGKKHSNEVREKMSVARRKRITSEETKIKMSLTAKAKGIKPPFPGFGKDNYQYGKTITEEHRNKLKQAWILRKTNEIK